MWWTIICTLVVYFIAGTWISVFFFRRSKWAACALPGFLTLGFLVGFSVGASLGTSFCSVFATGLSIDMGECASGAVLGAVYQSAEISMSPTIALVWGILLTVIIVMSSLSKSTALL